MNQQPRIRPNNPYERITELELKLNRANRYIRRLRQDNSELRRQLASTQKRSRQPFAFLERDVALEPERAPRRRRRRVPRPAIPEGVAPERIAPERIDDPRRLLLRRARAKRPQLRLAVMAIALAAVSILTLSSVIRLFARRPVTEQPSSSSVQPAAAVVPQLPASPLQAPDYTLAQIAPLSRPYPELSPEKSAPEYNVTTSPDFKPSKDLQNIVDELVNIAVDKGRPTNDLSITLINAKTGEIAGYQQQELRYPASVLKLFWMVYLYGALAQGILPDEQAFTGDLYRMIQQSANDAASRIIDATTGTQSGEALKGEAYENWKQRRLQLSEFFQKAGYDGLIVSQKTYSNLKEPKGREGQMWDDPQQKIRNKISTDHAARLMYEIVTGRAVSPEYSQKMLQWLTRDLSPEALVDKTRYGGFDPIEGYFGKSLPSDVDFASKAGISSTGRHEVAFVKTRDGKVAYILAVLASDRAYANDWGIFPSMSRYVFDRMNERS